MGKEIKLQIEFHLFPILESLVKIFLQGSTKIPFQINQFIMNFRNI